MLRFHDPCEIAIETLTGQCCLQCGQSPCDFGTGTDSDARLDDTALRRLEHNRNHDDGNDEVFAAAELQEVAAHLWRQIWNEECRDQLVGPACRLAIAG